MSNHTPETGGDRRVLHRFHDFESDTSLSFAILEAIEELSRTDTTGHDESLSEYVDPDALDSLFAPRLDGTPRAEGGSVSLSLYDHDVVVHSDGHIIVSRSDE